MDPDWVAPWATQETERWGMFNSWFVTSPGPTWRSWLSCSLGASSDPNLPTEKKHYQEWYISDTPDRDRSSPGSVDSGGAEGGGRTRRRRSRSPPQLDSCRGSAGSRRSSGSKVGSGQRASGEMSVDGPSSSSNGDALGRDDRVPDGHSPLQDTIAVVQITLLKTTGQSADALHQITAGGSRACRDSHSRSLDDVRLGQCQGQLSPPGPTLASPAFHSYTFGYVPEGKALASSPAHQLAGGGTQGDLYRSRSGQCISLSLLGDDGICRVGREVLGPPPTLCWRPSPFFLSAPWGSHQGPDGPYPISGPVTRLQSLWCVTWPAGHSREFGGRQVHVWVSPVTSEWDGRTPLSQTRLTAA
ncbi:uncharacterized protein LOC114808963 [Ornithorhynchus anatinus]|uniref:uncharacterized protein LOC114808963 n=1 Tax=Ornithorhynchus anatinus TaxID=9258 RepID=UPI0019D46CC2|nr:uncharacterized protein LOC114808963 [Ornithorhynchus anatinus]